MVRRPEFSIIAGPNGAGKSRLCPFYIPTKSFDGDKLSMQLSQEHPDWPERWIQGTVVGELEKQKTQAIQKHIDFAFETNFSSDMPIRMIDEFRNAGYKIALYYFGLLSEDESISRVIQRFVTGGHDVPEEIIRYNFHEGLKRITASLALFENLTFIDGNSTYGKIIAMHISKNRTHKVTDDLPTWFTTQFQEKFDELV